MHGDYEVDAVYRARLQRITVSGVVFTSRALLDSVILTSSGGNSGCTLYEGENTKGREIIRLESLDSTSVVYAPRKSSYLESGLYVALDDGNAEVTIQHSPVRQK